MDRIYKCLNRQVQIDQQYAIVPLRSEDRYKIMQWRNEQIYHLRQNKLLTKQDQDNYFDNVIINDFENEQPAQVLFSFLKDNECIGYGGLVHINYTDRNAEISFLMDTQREKEYFEINWMKYLSLIEKTAFDELELHKIFTYAFDLRPHLYAILHKAGFTQEARLKEHCFFENKFIDVLIHAKINSNA